MFLLDLSCASCGEYHLEKQLISDSFIIRQYRLPEGETLLEKLIEEDEKSSIDWFWKQLLNTL